MTDYLKVRVAFLSTSSGGRSTEVFLQPRDTARYMPHFRVGAKGEYLGVVFLEGNPGTVSPGQESDATVALMYGDAGVDYSPLVPGVEFEVVEVHEWLLVAES